MLDGGSISKGSDAPKKIMGGNRNENADSR